VAGLHGALLLGQQRDRAARSARRAARRHDPQDLERGDDPVARRRVLEDDDVAALLAAEAGADDLHPLEDVLVADGRPDDLAAGASTTACSPPFERTDTTRPPPAGAAAEPVEGEDAQDLVAVDDRPPASTAISRSASPSRANPTSAPRRTTASASERGAVAPQRR
jgi:hypothetical protein